MDLSHLNKVEQFAAYYCQDDLKTKVPAFHRELYALADSGEKRIVIAAPRGHAKSTILSKIYPLYQICLGNKSVKRIIIMSATAALAEHWLSEIKSELENNKYILADMIIIRLTDLLPKQI